jgi:2,4-dienoyl-CoA reductase (NADPH2)
MKTPPEYPHLLSPLQLGRHTLRNRIVMGAMHTRLEQAANSLERRIRFYGERARGGVALIVSAGYSPNEEGRLEADAQVLDRLEQLDEHRPIVAEVHRHGAKILLQILHAGRYAKHDLLVGPSAIASPIGGRIPRCMDEEDIERTIEDFAVTARLAVEAGYDGVELMGSEGYLINQFCARRTNQRGDRWGGSLANRCRFPLEVLRRVREGIGSSALLAYRISALDLVQDGMTGEEVCQLARAIEGAGADLISTGIGWHESPVPTIAYHVPRGAWRFATLRLKAAVRIPVVASNRINTPELAEEIVARGEADLVSLARPLLADPDFVSKTASGRAQEINTCIACNQACLDRIFRARSASCLVNPRAGIEIDLEAGRTPNPKRIGIVGAGPAGVSCAIHCAGRGHRVILFEAEAQIGGQLNLARRIPGKGEFLETLRYFRQQLSRHSIELRLGARATASSLIAARLDHIVIATGSVPRQLEFPVSDPTKVATYSQIILGQRMAGTRVAVIGTGGVAHDVAEFLTAGGESTDLQEFFEVWGVDDSPISPGGLRAPRQPVCGRSVQMFQRQTAGTRARLGASTGWILRRKLKARGVLQTAGCEYLHIDHRGLHYRIGGKSQIAEVDTVVVCAGQEPERELAASLRQSGVPFDVIGGALATADLDAARATSEGVRLADSL